MTCRDGFLISQSGTQCLPEGHFENCQDESQEEWVELDNGNWGCSRCDDGYYFDLETEICQECLFENAITCTPDEILECPLGFRLTVDAQYCLPLIANCIHQIPDGDSDFTCAMNCEEGFIWNAILRECEPCLLASAFNPECHMCGD